MPAKLSEKKIIKIRKEIRNGKSRRQIAKETNLSVDTVGKYGKNITSGKINDELKSIIRKEVISGKTKIQVAINYGISYHLVKKYTKGIRTIFKISVELEQQIIEEVKKGKTKIQVANEFGISYCTIRKYTRDIPTILRISAELEQQIIEEVKKGKAKRQVARELNICNDVVIKYTRDIPKNSINEGKKPSELIKQIIANVKKYNSKLETARKMGLTYYTVRKYTKDIKIKRGLSSEKRELIRNEVKNGKPKIQISRELNISPEIVYYNTKDIIVGYPHGYRIAGNTLKLLKEIMENGYAKPSKEYNYKCYQKLRLKFSNIRRVKMYGKIIYFIQEQSDTAMRVFLEELNKKIISYQELQQIINVFDGKMVRKDKKKYIRNRE